MQKEFIPYEQAVALKELGFDEPCLKNWDSGLLMVCDYATHLKAPLYQQAFRWFRKKGLYHDIKMFGDWDKPQFSYIVSGRTMNNPAHMYYYEDKDSYEQAELECLKKLIEIAKNNQK